VVLKNPNSGLKIYIQLIFVDAICNDMSTDDKTEGLASILLQERHTTHAMLDEWFAGKSLSKTLVLNIIRTLMKTTIEIRAFNLIIAIDWMRDAFKMNSVDYECSNIESLYRGRTERYNSYVTRMRALFASLEDAGVSTNILQHIRSSQYATSLMNAYLPTEYFAEFQGIPEGELVEIFWKIFDDPYARSKKDWKLRLQTARDLYGEFIDVPDEEYITKRNESPGSASRIGFRSQILSEAAMMEMVNKWNWTEFKKISGAMRGSDADALMPFMHGMMQYIATTHTHMQFPVLYRGLFAIRSADALDEFFPVEGSGRRRSLKDGSFISTSWNLKVSKKMYAQRNAKKEDLSSSNEFIESAMGGVSGKGLLMHIMEPSPITLLPHAIGQDEALLMPGTFVFVEHLKTTKTYDVIVVKYTPDLRLMKTFPGVYKLYQRGLEN